MIRAGIFGISLSGKTTLAKKISLAYALKGKMPSIVLDPFGEDWGEHAKVYSDDEEKFWEHVWKTEKCLIVVDECSSTIRREKELIPVFTSLRHLNHKLLVIGHHGADLLPVMRDQLDTVYLFRQNEKSAKYWVEKFADERVMQSISLNQYEYLFCRNFKPPVKCKATL